MMIGMGFIFKTTTVLFFHRVKDSIYSMQTYVNIFPALPCTCEILGDTLYRQVAN